MFQKEFFNTSSFNPNPYLDNVIINLTGAQKFDADTLFFPGKYKVEVKAGNNHIDNSGASYGLLGFGGFIVENIEITTNFIVRAYCGSCGNVSVSGGINPYSGPFKVNGYSVNGVPPTINHIFGNAGSVGGGTGYDCPSSGNSLGNGAMISRYGWSSGAGSCLHIMPVGGVFGTDYLFAFHTTGGVAGLDTGGSGGAYGGGASGTSASMFGESVVTTSNGGSTPYGQGGAGVNKRIGNDGTGIGHGRADGIGAAAWFNGSYWQDSSADPSSVQLIANGYIKITYLGPLNQ